jgi:hypothetical protein
VTPRELRPVLHRGVREGLKRIMYLKRAFIAFVLGWPVIGMLAIEMGLPLLSVMAVWGLGGLALWMILMWSRCPRCDDLFFDGVRFLFLPGIEMFRRRCSHCALDMRQLRQ